MTIGNEKLKMVREFVYLGHLIRYDGDKLPNLKRSINLKPKLLLVDAIPNLERRSN